MAVLLLHIRRCSDARVKDLVIHGAADYSCSSTLSSIYIWSPPHDDDDDDDDDDDGGVGL